MVEVTLPHGYNHRRRWRRSLWLRPWNGHDESVALEEAAECPAARATLLLARCVFRTSGGRPVSSRFVRRLTAGDRDVLMLHLRRITVGGTMPSLWKCGQCGEAMELELDIERLIGPLGVHTGFVQERLFEHEGIRYKVRFRVPNGGDLEAVAALARRDTAAAEGLLLARCVEEVRVTGEHTDRLPVALVAPLCEAMKQLDPQAEVLLGGTCCGCGEQFEVCCDAAQLVFREMGRARAAREREVHLLAYHYHWSEREILALTGRQRERYVHGLLEGLAGRRG